MAQESAESPQKYACEGPTELMLTLRLIDSANVNLSIRCLPLDCALLSRVLGRVRLKEQYLGVPNLATRSPPCCIPDRKRALWLSGLVRNRSGSVLLTSPFGRSGSSSCMLGDDDQFTNGENGWQPVHCVGRGQRGHTQKLETKRSDGSLPIR